MRVVQAQYLRAPIEVITALHTALQVQMDLFSSPLTVSCRLTI